MLQLSDLFFWRGAFNRTGLPNIRGDELATLLADVGNAGKGALISNPGLQTITVSTPTLVNFTPTPTIVYDDFGFFEGALPTRLTIPATPAISRVRVWMMVQWNSSATGDRIMQSTFNGVAGGIGAWRDIKNNGATGFVFMSGVSQTIEVVPGDFFEVTIEHNNGATLPISRADFGLTIER